MSLRVDTASLITSALVCGHRGLGVLGSAVPSSGDSGAGYLYNDLSLPADAGKEVCGRITAWPSAGTLTAYEDSSFIFEGAPDGAYTFDYQLYVDGAATGSPATVSLLIGSAPATIACSPGNATAAGSTASLIAGQTLVCTVGNAAAAGVTAGITQAAVLACSVGNTAAAGVRAAIGDGAVAVIGSRSAPRIQTASRPAQINTGRRTTWP